MSRLARLDLRSLTVAAIPMALVLLGSLFLLQVNARMAISATVDSGRTLLSNQITAELENHVAVALTSIQDIYANATAADTAAQEEAKRILRSIRWGKDGYFFAYHYDGTGLVVPDDPSREGQNWYELKDADGKPLIRILTTTARNGGGSYVYKWEKLTTGVVEDKVSYVVGLDEWQWMVGTGVYFSEIAAAVDDLEIVAKKAASQEAIKAWLILLLVGVAAVPAAAFVAVNVRRKPSEGHLAQHATEKNSVAHQRLRVSTKS